MDFKIEWVLLALIVYLIYLFFKVVATTKQPRNICKRHTWQEALSYNPNTGELARIMFCSVCLLLPSEDINNLQFLEREK